MRIAPPQMKIAPQMKMSKVNTIQINYTETQFETNLIYSRNRNDELKLCQSSN